jgi:glutamyl-tRNA synthetase
VSSPAGRFAPSPTGDLHLGNLRTALVAWLSARSQGLDFRVRMEDLDRITSSKSLETAQIDSLVALGLDIDGEVVRQSERFELYEAAIVMLAQQDRTYACYCTRREIREASSAPQGTEHVEGTYPGTCRTLSDSQRRRYADEGRPSALRLRADAERVEVMDDLLGSYTAVVDDVVLRRNDGVPAYNLAVVVDDAAQHVVEVVRGDDLLSSTPRQVLLQRLLRLPTPRYRHVPLVLGPDGHRLAKRHGDVTLAQLSERGLSPAHVLALLAQSLGLATAEEVANESVRILDLVGRFDLGVIPTKPWVIPTNLQRSVP